MSLLNYNPAPFDSTLVGTTSDLIGDHKYASTINQSGSGKSKKKSSKKVSVKKPVKKSSSKKSSIKKSPKKLVKSTTKKVSSKKVKKEKEISKYSKVQLEKLAKQNGITLRKRDGTARTKEQLFRSLKRKKLI